MTLPYFYVESRAGTRMGTFRCFADAQTRADHLAAKYRQTFYVFYRTEVYEALPTADEERS